MIIPVPLPENSGLGVVEHRPKTPLKVKAPGIALSIVGVLDTLYAILNCLSHLNPETHSGPMPSEFRNNEFMREMWKSMSESDPVVGTLVSILMAIVGAIIIFGGIRMLKMSNYALSITASILSMLPCVTALGCCGIGQAVGIWSFVVLLSQDVKSGFIRNTA
ncbi:MAG: hypothetical protein JW829_19345 [Pirellulales bacterium]|nr:hypothetical protein [Pirellulales bacterium]